MPRRTKGLRELTAYRDAMHKNPGLWIGADFHDLRPGQRIASHRSNPMSSIAVLIRKHKHPFDDGHTYEAYCRGVRLYARLVPDEEKEQQ
ncbi:hypothetical protein [Corynebacterium sp. 13CS0277]|uniref:hypothetical protein n=1 Tax=Corynebacterium sp. 13CS0277 TaxID=2071994 RepID=UPI0011B24C64|nr:hypothetical protein [Corynebacterium sp. 13CS0277]